MKSMFIKTDVDEIIERINKLTPETQRQWGKMNVEQMLVHCRYSVETATGDRFAPRTFMGRLIGGFFKPMTTNDKSFGHGSPTSSDFIITDTESFEIEKNSLIELVQKLYDGGKANVTDKPHAFFGHLNPTQWGALMHKHLDHHLKQFGV